jgi:DNA-binding transcriptional LysR family regulator
MTLDQLSLFTTVAELSSFSKAATKLGVRRSSLGVQLFSRTTRRVALTTAGKTLHAKVAPHLAALYEAVGTLPERETEPSGVLRITAPNDIGAILLPDVFAGFALRYPAVQLDVRLSNRRVDLVDEAFDLAIRVAAGRMTDSSLVAKRIANADLHIYASPQYVAAHGTPRTNDEALRHAWITFPNAAPPPLPRPKAPRMITDDIRLVHEMVRAGVGLGALPTFLASEDVLSGRLVRVLPRLSLRSGAVYLVHPPTKHVPRKVLAFRDYLLERLAAHPLLGRAA